MSAALVRGTWSVGLRNSDIIGQLVDIVSQTTPTA